MVVDSVLVHATLFTSVTTHHQTSLPLSVFNISGSVCLYCCWGLEMKDFSFVKQWRAKTKRAVTWFYVSHVSFCPKIERRVLEWFVLLIGALRQWGIQIPLRESEGPL
jgi:hypothetical protein